MEYLRNYYSTTTSASIREWVESFMNTVTCPVCNGGRLKKESLSVKFAGKNISEITNLSINRAIEFFAKLKLTGRDAQISKPILEG